VITSSVSRRRGLISTLRGDQERRHRGDQPRGDEIHGGGGDRAAAQGGRRDVLEEARVAYTAAEVVISHGAKHSIYNALFALTDPGDEVLILSPYWTSYPDMVKILGGKPRSSIFRRKRSTSSRRRYSGSSFPARRSPRRSSSFAVESGEHRLPARGDRGDREDRARIGHRAHQRRDLRVSQPSAASNTCPP